MASSAHDSCPDRGPGMQGRHDAVPFHHCLHRRTRFLLPALACALLLTAAPGAFAERPVRSLQEIRQQGIVMQQWDISCAAAALATVLTYHRQHPVTEEQVARSMLRHNDPARVQRRGGFSMLDMKRFAAEAGFDGDGYSDMGIDDLAPLRPVIVPIRMYGFDHFVVVREVTAHDVDIADPSFGNYRLPRAEFAGKWQGLGFALAPQTGGS